MIKKTQLRKGNAENGWDRGGHQIFIKFQLLLLVPSVYTFTSPVHLEFNLTYLQLSYLEGLPRPEHSCLIMFSWLFLVQFSCCIFQIQKGQSAYFTNSYSQSLSEIISFLCPPEIFVKSHAAQAALETFVSIFSSSVECLGFLGHYSQTSDSADFKDH